MYRYLRLGLLLLIDATLIIASVYGAYLLRFDFSIKKEFLDTLPYVFLLFTITIICSFYFFKVYKRIWQYANISDLFSIFKGVFVGVLITFIVHHEIINKIYTEIVVPRSIYAITLLICFLSVGSSRFIWKLIRDNYGKAKPYQRRALIVGAGAAGVMIAKEMRRIRSEQYPVAFIDDNEQKKNYEVIGIPVIGTRNDIPNIAKKYKINDIIIAIPTATRSEISNIVSICKETNCQIKIVPNMNDLISGKIEIKTIRNVSVEDLLGRDPIQLDVQSVAGYLSNRNVLVTGAGGSIGSELCRQIAKYRPSKLLLLGRGENSIYNIEMELKKTHKEIEIIPIIADIQDKSRLINIFEQHRPQVIFHAAAHKHVPLMEANPIEAVKNNILGTYHIASCAHQYSVDQFVMISTDKAVNSTNVMGATKRAAEMIVQSLDQISQTRFAAVRFGNVLGSRGSVIPLFKKQIEAGGPVTVTHPDMIRYFMTIPEAVQLVIQSGALTGGGEVFILDMGEPVRIVDLARDLIRLSGLEPDKEIKIEFTGIRPGEKLFEELLTAEEGASSTKFDRIYIGKPSFIRHDEMMNMVNQFEQLIKANESVPTEVIKNLLKKWVPNYQYHDKTNMEKRLDTKQTYYASREIVAARNSQ